LTSGCSAWKQSKVETVYWQIAKRIVDFCAGMKYVPTKSRNSRFHLADQYVCNFSVFQSLLDHWAPGSALPVMPIHRLNEFPERQVRWSISPVFRWQGEKFIDLQDVKDTLSLHKLNPGEHYYLGFFSWAPFRTSWVTCTILSGRVNRGSRLPR